jgi:hypothetical protein
VTKNPKIKFHSGTKGLLTLMERRVIPFGEWKHANADALQLWKRSVDGFAERAPQEPYVVRVKLVAEHLDLYFVNVLALVRFDSVECFTLRPVLPQWKRVGGEKKNGSFGVDLAANSEERKDIDPLARLRQELGFTTAPEIGFSECLATDCVPPDPIPNFGRKA